MSRCNRIKGTEQRAIEVFLSQRGHDFTAVFMAVNSLAATIRGAPDLADQQTISILARVLTDREIARQRQSLALFREVSESIKAVFTRGPDHGLMDYALSVLQGGLRTLSGIPHRAVTETLGSLEVAVRGPKLVAEQDLPILELDWPVLARSCQALGTPVFFGRSLVISQGLAGDELLVLKLARDEDDVANLTQELAWMGHLGSGGYDFPVRFEVPGPITIKGCRMFRLRQLPLALPLQVAATPAPIGIAYTVAHDYFRYPNEQGPAASGQDQQERLAAIRRAALLLGRLAGSGIIHTAPIPLFHNRTQQQRRPDQGLYDWRQAGRLDAWLGSCRHPNFGVSGLRDFEHFLSFSGPPARLYRFLGDHILSLLLVGASFFRSLEPGRRGLDQHGRPVDASDLFASPVFTDLVLAIFQDYYQGFVGAPWQGELPFGLDVLVDRMIEEMGVDRHMVEILRVPDQQRMDEQEFRGFLLERGYSRAELASIARGVRELPVYTGPHLGAFNQPISIPELIEATGAMAASCMLGRFLKEPPGRIA